MAKGNFVSGEINEELVPSMPGPWSHGKGQQAIPRGKQRCIGEAQRPSLRADLLCRPLGEDIVEPGWPACWGPHRRAEGPEQTPWLRVGSVPASPGCWGVQGLQGTADEDSLEQHVQSRVTCMLGRHRRKDGFPLLGTDRSQEGTVWARGGGG